MKKKYQFARFADVPFVSVMAGYAKAEITNGEAELDPGNENDQMIIKEFGGVEAPKPAVKKTSKKDGK